MSKICDKCGSVIPDDLDYCPNCGTEDYNEEAFRDVLSGLGLSLEDSDSGDLGIEGKETLPAFNEIFETDEVKFDIPDQDILGHDIPERDITEFDIPEQDIPEQEEPDKEESVSDNKKQKKPKSGKSAKEKKNKKNADSSKKPAPKKAKKVREIEEEDDLEYDDDYEYEKKPMKKRSAAIIGVLIGLFVALLLIAGVGGFMLYRLGVFNPVTDDDLLGAVQSPAPSVEATPVPVILPEPSEEPEASVVEEPVEVISSVDEPVEPEDTAEHGKKPNDVQVDEFTLLSDESITLYSRGETSDIDYVIEPESAKSEIVWASDNILVADVDDYGTILARRGGECTITGTVGDQVIEVSVFCDFEVPLTVLDMNYEDITMSYEGQTVQLAIDYELSDEYVKATVWESSDPSVATVDDKGLVTAVADGTAVIQASIAEYTASCIIRCVDVTGNKGYNNDESEYVINYEDVTLTRKGEYFQLTLKSILPDGEVPEFTWTSDDPSVATVDNKGIVTAVSDGVAYITTSIGDDQFRCIVRVNIS